MISVVVIQAHEIVVDSAGWIYHTSSLVCIYLSSRFANPELIFEGFIRVGSRCKIIVAMDGFIAIRFINCALLIRTLIHMRLIQVAFGCGHVFRGCLLRYCAVSPWKLVI